MSHEDFDGLQRSVAIYLCNITKHNRSLRVSIHTSCSRGELSLHLNPVSKGFVAIIKGAISYKKYIQGYIVTYGKQEA